MDIHRQKPFGSAQDVRPDDVVRLFYSGLDIILETQPLSFRALIDAIDVEYVDGTPVRIHALVDPLGNRFVMPHNKVSDHAHLRGASGVQALDQPPPE